LDKSNMLGDRKEDMEGLMAMQDLVAIDRVSFVLQKYFFPFLKRSNLDLNYTFVCKNVALNVPNNNIF
jgi:hypothetical protein